MFMRIRTPAAASSLIILLSASSGVTATSWLAPGLWFMCRGCTATQLVLRTFKINAAINVSCNICFILLHMFWRFLPNDAMLARYMLFLCVCPSVRPSICLSFCLSHAGIVPKRLYLGSRKTTYDSPGTL